MDSPAAYQSRIAVIYLARKAEGIPSFQAFINSYATYQAGIEHDLVIVFKGFDDKSELEIARKEFARFSHFSVELNDEGFDTGSYLQAAKQLPHEYICCLNTFSEIRSENWLQKLYAHASLPNIGIVGTTGSYEGLRDSMTLIQKAIWLNSQQLTGEALRADINRYFEFILQPKGGRKFPSIYNILRMVYRYLKGLTSQAKYSLELEDSYRAWWNKVKDIGDIASFCQFPAFPNPHIRSNAFMIKREYFLSLKHNNFETKFDACRFESGHQGMTQQLIQMGLRALIVGKNGAAYDVKNWAKSETFRLGNQANLLVADNQTRIYQTANRETQFIHSLMSWGEDAVRFPNDFPDFGIKFQVKSL